MRKHCRTRAPRDVLATIVLFACMGCQTPQDADSINNPFTVSGVRVEPDSLNAYLAAHRGFTSRGGEMRCAYRPLGQERNRVFVWAICSELLAIDGHLVDGAGIRASLVSKYPRTGIVTRRAFAASFRRAPGAQSSRTVAVTSLPRVCTVNYGQKQQLASGCHPLPPANRADRTVESLLLSGGKLPIPVPRSTLRRGVWSNFCVAKLPLTRSN